MVGRYREPARTSPPRSPHLPELSQPDPAPIYLPGGIGSDRADISLRSKS